MKLSSATFFVIAILGLSTTSTFADGLNLQPCSSLPPTSSTASSTAGYGDLWMKISTAEAIAVAGTNPIQPIPKNRVAGFCYDTAPQSISLAGGVVAMVGTFKLWVMNNPVDPTQGVTLYTMTGDGQTDYRVHLIDIDLSNTSIDVTPSVACYPNKCAIPSPPNQYAPGTYVQNIPDMVNNLKSKYSNVLAGINGGYDYRIDDPGFSDNICPNRSVAPLPQAGVNQMGDDYLRLVDSATGNIVVENPNCSGATPGTMLEQPALFLNGPNSYFSFIPTPNLLQSGASPINILGAGPMLVENGTYYMTSALNSHGGLNIAWDDMEIGGAVAVGLLTENKVPHMLLVGVEGSDSQYAMNNFTLATLMLSLGVNAAMALGNGGDASLWTSASDSSFNMVSQRPVYDGLFVVAAHS